MQIETSATPAIREMRHAEIEAVLLRNHIGRLAFSRGNRLTITPVTYVYSNGWLYGRTAEGHKMRELSGSAYNWWPVVFEVDEVEAMFSWRSVVVHGGFQMLQPGTPESPIPEWDLALDALRTLMPQAFTDADPVPARKYIFRISSADTTGREALPS